MYSPGSNAQVTEFLSSNAQDFIEETPKAAEGTKCATIPEQ